MKDGGENALIHVTHGPTIDVFGAHTLKWLEVNTQKRTAKINNKFEKAISPGEMYVGNIADLTVDNPIIELTDDSTQGAGLVTSLKELSTINDKLKEHAYNT
ncbi:MAG: hypothetical protein ABH828_04735 [archaeon]